MRILEDWYFEILLPYFNSKGPGKKVMIVDNLASHISSAVIKSYGEPKNLISLLIKLRAFESATQLFLLGMKAFVN